MTPPENILAQLADAVMLGENLSIRYSNPADGKVTERVIRPEHFNEMGHLEAHCYLRGDRRTFDPAGILDWRIAETDPEELRPFGPLDILETLTEKGPVTFKPAVGGQVELHWGMHDGCSKVAPGDCAEAALRAAASFDRLRG